MHPVAQQVGADVLREVSTVRSSWPDHPPAARSLAGMQVMGVHSPPMRFLRFGVLSGVLVFAGCSSNTGASDAGTDIGARDVFLAADSTPDADATPDAGACQGESAPSVAFRPSVIVLTPGAQGDVTVLLAQDRCAPAVLPVSVSGASATVAVTTVTVPPGESTATVTVTGVSPGTATLTVGGATYTIKVIAAGVPACPTSTPAVMATLSPGGTVAGPVGSPLAGASVGLVSGAAVNPPVISPFTATLGCAPDQIPTGYTAIGPAITIGPADTVFLRELPMTLPVNGGMVPPGYELHVEVSFSDVRFRTPRIVPVADVHLSDDGSTVHFSAPRLGTYQAVIRTGLGTTHHTRHFTFHAILGVSMGAAGASAIGARHMDLFDFIAPLGGPVDWAYLGDYIEHYHLGGFCTEAQRTADPTGCAMGASVAHTPPVNELFEHPQDFEHWFYLDGDGGQGGSFDRSSYIEIFRDLTRMFGNAVINPGPTGVLPAGVPDSELARSDTDRCASPWMPIVLHDYYDAEYNPAGTYPVITFCDGTHTAGHNDIWDGALGTEPMEVTLAVDINGNGRRDYGEPVIRQFHEPFRDYGTDGTSSAMEPGYNPVTNPDPAGDDYDRQYNPSGTEGNFVYDMGEPYDDVGVDGVVCPAGHTCPYDRGEGNGHFDLTPGSARFLARNPRAILAQASATDLSRIEVWNDGGVRDLFNFGCDGNHLVGALTQAGRSVHYFNNFASLAGGRVPEDPFPFSNLDWARLPGNVMERYGSQDATATDLIAGDGGHVGTVPQITNRLFSSLWWVQARWPGGNRAIQTFSSAPDNAGMCANGYFCNFPFTSTNAHRTGPVSIYLPPGYHDPANASVRYPVVFFLHGYGQQPMDLAASGLIIGNYMVSPSLASWQRPQKYIMVFPDGRCRPGDGCLQGTFYTDSPIPGNAQMETYFLDLYHFIDSTYRVRAPEDIDVVE